MHSRAVRAGVLALLLVSGAVAGVLSWQHDTERRVLAERTRALEAGLARTLPAIADIAAAQRAYVDYGLRDEATFARITELLQQTTASATRFRLSTEAAAGRARIDEALTELANLTAAAGQARGLLAATDPLAAADVLLGSMAQQRVAALSAALRGFQGAELEWLHDRRAAVDTQTRVTVGVVALLWVTGVLALARHGQPAALPVAESPRGLGTLQAPAPTAEPAHTVQPGVDLTATAAVCSTIARLADAAMLPSVLERAAAILDARGIVVWMSAGDELFPAAAWGYDGAVMQQLRPLPRGADNATAAAWRNGEALTVPGDASRPGAIVAPMCAPGGCSGVLTAEVRNGRESDAGTLAVAAIIAAQLSGVLAAWPAATGPAGSAGNDRATAAGDSGRRSERNAAAL